MIRPLNNHCLIEIIDEYEGIIGSDMNQNVQKGRLLEFNLTQDHLTASTGYFIAGNFEDYAKELTAQLGKVVYWQEYADAGSKFDVDGKHYVLVPWYRLIGFDDETTKKEK